MQFELRIRNNYKTNGGRMFDVNVTFEDRETTHRVIVGKEYYEEFDLDPEEVLVMTFQFLLKKKTPRQTEGAQLLSRECPQSAELHLCRHGSLPSEVLESMFFVGSIGLLIPFPAFKFTSAC